MALGDVAGQVSEKLGVDGAEEPLDLAPALGTGDGGVDQPDVQVNSGAGEVAADEVTAVVDIEHVRQPAHRPRGVALVPDSLPQRQGGVHRGRRTQEDGVAADRAGAVIEDRRQPGADWFAVGAHHENVEQRVVTLPHRIRLFGVPAQHQFVLVPVGRRALQG